MPNFKKSIISSKLRSLFSLFFRFWLGISAILAFFPTPALASDAVYQWTRTMGSTENDTGQSVSVDTNGNVYITGKFKNTVDFDPSEEGIDNKTASGTSYDIFITKFQANGAYVWTKTIGGSGDDLSRNLTIDLDDNLYVTGSFKNTIDFDPGEGIANRISLGGDDIFISKYDSSGTYLWTKTVGASGNDGGTNLKTDSQNNLYVTGYFRNTVDFDPGDGTVNKTSMGGSDIFITKYQSDGIYLWTKTVGGSGDDASEGISIDSQDNLYVGGGYFKNTVDFDPSEGSIDSRTSAGADDNFVSKYNADGSYAWTKTIGGLSTDRGSFGLDTDSQDNVYITGYFYDTTDFNPDDEIADIKISNGSADIYIAKFQANGSYLWAKTIGGSDYEQGYSLSLDQYDNVYVTGYFRGEVDFDPSEGIDIKTSNGADIYITRYQTDGLYNWTKAIGGSGSESGYGLFMDRDNNIYVTGFFYYTVDFDPNEVVEDIKISKGSGDIYISKFVLDDVTPEILLTDQNYTCDTTPTFSGTATDALGTVNSVEYQMDITSGNWTACESNDEIFDEASEAFACDVSSALTEGTHTIYIKATDSHTNTTASGSETTDEFIVDLTVPTGSISINSGETITNTDEVTLTLSAIDNLTEVSKMMVSNKGDYNGGTWETYNTSKEWRLSMGDGEKRVYVKYRDEVGNISSSNSDSIEMDMGSPTGTLIINEGEEYTSSREVVLHITGEDEVTGVEEMRISEDRTMEGVEWEGYETSREYTLSEGDGYKVIYIQYRDGIGNESEVYGSNITLDRNTEIEVTEIGEEEVEGEITNWETEETTPTLVGEGEVGATITIEIEGIETGTVVVNEDGVWSWTPSIELTKGQEYNVIITSTDLAGNEDIQIFTLEIANEEVIEVNQTTPEAQITTTQLPNTGVMIIVGLMVMGGLIWTGVNFKVIERLRKRKI